MQYAVSRRLVGGHSITGEVTPPLGTSDWGVIQPGESLIPLTSAPRAIGTTTDNVGEIRGRHVCAVATRGGRTRDVQFVTPINSTDVYRGERRYYSRHAL